MSTREHLGERLSALADGELSHEERERALSHVTHCPECRAALDAERAVKARLAALAGAIPGDTLLARLHALGDPGDPLPPERPRMPGGSARRPVVPPPGRPPAGRRPRSRDRAGATRSHRRLQLAAAGTLSAVAVVIGTAFVAGGATPHTGTPVLPPVDQFSVEHAATSDGLPLFDPAFGAVTTTSFGLPAPHPAPSLVSTAAPTGR